MNAPIVGALVGLIAAAGFLSVISRYRSLAPITISMRVIRASHGSIPELTALIPIQKQVGVLSVLRELLGPHSGWITRLGNADKLIERLQKAGKTTGDRRSDLSRYRWEQITWAALGLVAGIVMGMWSIGRGSNPIALAFTVALGIVIGFFLHDRHVSGMGRKRVERIDSQFPDLAELLAFSVTAGETSLAALTRIAHLGQGDLANELET